MIAAVDLRAIAHARLEDAKVLFAGGRLDAAAYMCGYVVELALKARITEMLGWVGFPDTRAEFEHRLSFKTHKLDVLLSFSGQERRIRGEHTKAWASVATWEPELRYNTVGNTAHAEVQTMIESAETLLRVL
jgi:hypothetical protein